MALRIVAWLFGIVGLASLAHAATIKVPAIPASGWWDSGYYAPRLSMLPSGRGRIEDAQARYPGHDDMTSYPVACSFPDQRLTIKCPITNCSGYFTCRRDYECPDASMTMMAPSGKVPWCEGAAPDIRPEKEKANCPAAGNPVNIVSGNKHQRETDVRGNGPFPIEFERFYNSRSYIVASHLGPRWRHTFDRSLQQAIVGFRQWRIHAYRPDGQVLMFERNANGSPWVTDPDNPERLEDFTDASGVVIGKRLFLPDGSHEQYDTDGKLVAIIDAEGRALTLTYNDYVQLTQVTGPFGERLQFFYEREPVEKAYRLARILDSTGQAYDYLYDTNNRLVGVRYPDATPGDDEDNPVRQYHYEDPALPTSLTGITDERGERFATWAYDPQGRVVSSEHADANGWVGFSYDDVNGITTVTDSLGHATQYHYAALFGVRHVTTTVGGPCDACGANAAHFTYDANGFVSSQTDFNGNITSYQRDAQGRELSRTEASGTPEARTVTTTWDTALNKPLTIEEPGRRMTYSYDTTGKVLSSTIEPVP